jgi:glyoxylase-like metal-dependent hydrolase (beta-lactamase superfamily II)
VARLQVQTLVTMPFAENTYIVWIDGSAAALVIDPGFGPEDILDFLRDRGLTPAAILNTHGHVDHIAGNAALKEAFPDAPLIIGSGDAPLLTDPTLNLSAFFGGAVTSPPADRLVKEGEDVEIAGIALSVLDVPGHSPGHVVFVHRPAAGSPVIFGGDVLFRGGIGRTDFPGGDLGLLLTGIRTKVFALPADTVVYTGHGPVTTVGHERRTNPFCGEG